MQISAKFDQLPDVVRRAAASDVWQRLPGSHPKSCLTRLKRFLASAEYPDAARRYFHMLSLFTDAQLDHLILDRERRRMFDNLPLLVYTTLLQHRDIVEAAIALDRIFYLPHDLLVKLDRASMLHALEVRSPFMDQNLVEFASTLTTRQLLKGGPKRMLREAFADLLPAWVFKRKKMGFAVPIGEWFRGELRPMLRDHLFAADAFGRSHFNMKVVQRLVDEHEREKVDHSQRLYALLMLELWWRTSRE
jgi:asparagine synthase (glutamine-hydrolysing)